MERKRKSPEGGENRSKMATCFRNINNANLLQDSAFKSNGIKGMTHWQSQRLCRSHGCG